MKHIYHARRVTGSAEPVGFARRAMRNSRGVTCATGVSALPVLLLALTACSEESQTRYSCPGSSRTLAATPTVGGAAATKVSCPPITSVVAGASGGPSTAVTAGAGGTETAQYTTGKDLWHRKPGRGEVKDPGKFVFAEGAEGRFGLVASGKAAPLVVNSTDYRGVVRAVNDLRADILNVTQVEPAVLEDNVPAAASEVVLIGTLGKSPLIDNLVAQNKLDVSKLKGHWETSVLQVLDQPMAGVKKALVIVGSDQRGTIFGVYELSRQIGVSPWYWWDDIPAPRQKALYVAAGRHTQGEPAVKFRGFFINDENPTTGKWASKKFGPGKAVVPKPTCDDAGMCTNKDQSYPGGLTHEYWERVFEVALRLKANYVWPAVWGRQFADDDPEALPTVRDYGIVLGTSHEAPMVRGIEEWNIRVDPTKRDSSGNITHKGTDPWGGTGEWAWTRNAESLKKYWREGIQRMADVGFDAVVTLAMRGTGDVAADETGKIDVLSQVLDAQRAIITDVTKQPITSVPQVWLLYKEVQTYWDKGMRAPDDVTIIWCDDNWGNMRKLQDSTMERGGGFGIYYHFDYVGGGRNYKWADTNLIPNIWEQLHLVYDYGVDRLWLVNVGDMKNEEVSLQFFLDYAWNPERWPLEKLTTWEEQWAEQQFGAKYAKEIAAILHEYAKLQSDRKPELTNRKQTVDPTTDFAKALAEATAKKAADANVNISNELAKLILTSDEAYFAKGADGKLLPVEQRKYYDDNPFSLTAYREMETVVGKWTALSTETKRVEALLLADSPGLKDAYYELVGYQVHASANLYALRMAQFKNLLYFDQGRAATTAMAVAAEARLTDDKAMSTYYNSTLAGGKWADWQTQPKIGYGDQDRYGGNAPWQQPELNNSALEDALFPLVKRLDVAALPPTMKVAIDGSTGSWAKDSTDPLPSFSQYQSQPTQYLEVFNAGSGTFGFELKAPPWMSVTYTPDVRVLDDTNKEVRAELKINWPAVPAGTTTDKIVVSSSLGSSVTIPVVIKSPTLPVGFVGFVESNGYVSMEADHFAKAVPDAAAAASQISWARIPDIGRTGAGMTPLPVTAEVQTPTLGGATPHLEYQMYLANTTPDKQVTVWAYLSPRNNVRRNAAGGRSISADGDGLRYAVSVDGGPLQLVDINVGCDDIYLNKVWEWHTSDNINRTATKHTISGPGVHSLKFWMVDPAVILQKIVVDTGTGELRDSYFGPPESFMQKP